MNSEIITASHFNCLQSNRKIKISLSVKPREGVKFREKQKINKR